MRGSDDLAPDDITEGMPRVVAETRDPQRFRERLLRANPHLKERLEMKPGLAPLPENEEARKVCGQLRVASCSGRMHPDYALVNNAANLLDHYAKGYTVLDLDALAPEQLLAMRHVYKRLCSYADLAYRLSLLQGVHGFTVENGLSIRRADGRRIPRKAFKEARGLLVGMARIWNDLPEWARWPKEFRQDWRLPKGVTGPAIMRHLYMANHMAACAVSPAEHCTCGLNAVIRAFEQQEGV